jgi:hypothetical protein
VVVPHLDDVATPGSLGAHNLLCFGRRLDVLLQRRQAYLLPAAHSWQLRYEMIGICCGSLRLEKDASRCGGNGRTESAL